MGKMLIVLCCAIAPSLAHGAISIFTDNFDSNAAGLNLTPSGWGISNGGTVDTIANGSFGITCAGNAGKCIDLDGSTGTPGELVSPGLNLLTGQIYTAFFDLSGNQRALTQTDVVSVSFGSTTTSVSVLGTDPFATHSVAFMPGTTGTYHLSFLNNGSNNLGAILDNVNVQAQVIPEPETYGMMIAGLVIVGIIAGFRRTKRY
jgi:PEP-CTERM motif-containing protein